MNGETHLKHVWHFSQLSVPFTTYIWTVPSELNKHYYLKFCSRKHSKKYTKWTWCCDLKMWRGHQHCKQEPFSSMVPLSLAASGMEVVKEHVYKNRSPCQYVACEDGRDVTISRKGNGSMFLSVHHYQPSGRLEESCGGEEGTQDISFPLLLFHRGHILS